MKLYSVLEFSMYNKYFIISTGIPFTATYDLKGWPDISSVGLPKPMSNSNLVLSVRCIFKQWVILQYQFILKSIDYIITSI